MAHEDASVSDNETQGNKRESNRITLVDHTVSTEEPSSGIEPLTTLTGISQTLTHGSIRQTLARRKYQRSKWQEGRDSQSNVNSSPNVSEEGEGSTSAKAKDTLAQKLTSDGSDGDAWGKGRVRRGGEKVKDAIRTSKPKGAKLEIDDPDSHIDVLYENQRGFFFAGIPRFSSNSLLNFDPVAWLDSRHRPSAVNITNAQVPDPSWEWSWRCWYVDMSGDVDEEGWEYSFWFGKGTAWHGTHPWFHSFVRRRRWLRKRCKRKTAKPKEAAHALTSDYFTIHSKTKHNEEDMDSTTRTEKRARCSVATSSAWDAKNCEDQADTMEVTNIPDLLRGLRAAAIDREKIVLVRRFLTDGGEELHYLAENMEHIMKLLVFQNSRRQLLSMLMHEFEAAERHRNEHKERGEEEKEKEKIHIDNLLKAVEAADAQCKQLGYWSDIRGMARNGEILHASDHIHGWDHAWDGLDTSGPDSKVEAPSDLLDDSKGELRRQDKGKRPVYETNVNRASNTAIDGHMKSEQAAHSIEVPGELASRPSVDSNRHDVFYSPQEEKPQAQAVPLRAETDAVQPVTETPTPSQESRLSIDTFQSAHSEAGEKVEEDDTATEKAPSEDEHELGTPPTGATPIDALTQVLNGQTEEGKSMSSQEKT
ncbi:uncharacterized protein PV09_01674 [Verruconis gallopava]|uniref:Peroxin/Ferlin domain-containing protein n=1 Tax=Verruconis gallopava TaxID=253628 RepID=A0A0D2B912_9PEZI|nr:uncharacterized protein PV09_01674 [Verruconis gallopava]KIW07744.1 hypothetical protein PV09_01674 [Verruconis gallopava]